MVFLRERFTVKSMERYYREVYAVKDPNAAVTVRVPESVDAIDSTPEYIGAQRKSMFEEAVQAYGKEINGATLIDIGCGWGALLYNARKHGMNAIG